jgi:hypothetical protein
MKRTYLVGVREIHARYYSVDAENPDLAKTLVSERANGVVDLDWEEYANELNQDTWSVEERSEGNNHVNRTPPVS